MDNLLAALLLGILEGLTEFLPVSSTGHLILAQAFLGYDPAQWRQFNIVIQLGAISAVIVTYRQTFWDMGIGLLRREDEALRFTRNILLGFVPAAIVGLIAKDGIDAVLESPMVVPVALLIGGIVILLLERTIPAREDTGVAAMSWQSKRDWHSWLPALLSTRIMKLPAGRMPPIMQVHCLTTSEASLAWIQRATSFT